MNNLASSSERAEEKAAIPAKVRRACVAMTAAGSVGGASRGITVRHLFNGDQHGFKPVRLG